ncbi:hypothetical protein [uncultured Marixanthomonas sp.]|uniref:hypothetical protein n=1 Tax=uncultured Marixanthomonas sp. TaxID=757245 RepID=UPI0030D9DE94|tara:strand:- start:29673 stop:30374 length:702 start_codon:yes stop_codon:yes gene_type:complete
MKKITLILLCVLCWSATKAQETSMLLQAPGETYEYSLEESFTQDKVQTFKEYSLGVMFMPIPLFIDEIQITQDGNTQNFSNDENIFNVGIGLVVNADFNESGLGFGSMGYFSIIGGEDIRAYDGFFALKYDFALGDPIDTNFEISPLLGLGWLQFQRKADEANYGSSYYVAGGLRLTWKIVNGVFVGADALTTPTLFAFNKEKLLGVDGEVDEVNFKNKTPVTLNISLRFNIL